MIPSKKEIYLSLIGINIGLLIYSLFLQSHEMSLVNILTIIVFIIAYEVEDKNIG